MTWKLDVGWPISFLFCSASMNEWFIFLSQQSIQNWISRSNKLESRLRVIHSKCMNLNWFPFSLIYWIGEQIHDHNDSFQILNNQSYLIDRFVKLLRNLKCIHSHSQMKLKKKNDKPPLSVHKALSVQHTKRFFKGSFTFYELRYILIRSYIYMTLANNKVTRIRLWDINEQHCIYVLSSLSALHFTKRWMHHRKCE